MACFYFFVYFVCFVVSVFQWWQLPQLWDEHEPQDEPEDGTNVSPLFMPNTENFFFTSCVWQAGHETASARFLTSFSNSFPHCPHWYSKIGISVFSDSNARVRTNGVHANAGILQLFTGLRLHH
ncbi:hypothetical protein U14_05681 [Candidatus Moduliflexus flocculans]|uniref:Uncharacterized protein n=1 Tax=Candidatus Moduliflexus flocculans TaxID=1499966 RepID=A0A081BSL5_9BACT|nr:hypothetical protein U14_05681 [Candidatus Moduliflexus flocculans]